MKKVRASAPGKLILLGEYAVLEGAPALVTAVNRFARVRREDFSGNETRYSLESPVMGIPKLAFTVSPGGEPEFINAGASMKDKLRFFSAAFKRSHELLKRKGRAIPPCHLVLDTSDFYYGEPRRKLGFGSSASLTLAVTGALCAAEPVRGTSFPDESGLYRAAVSAHHLAQGRTGSGIDIAASAHGGLLEYRIHEGVKKLRFPEALHYLPVWTGKPASTTGMLSGIGPYKEKNPGQYRALINDMARLSADGILSLRENNAPGFLEAVNGYFQAMELLGRLCGVPVISNEHRGLFQLALDNGAVYKPSGAGGGDCGIAFALSKDIIQRTRNAMKKAGFICPDIAMVERGLEISEEQVES